jgi:hypothetical protein
MTFPSNADGTDFGASYMGRFQLQGDFDMKIDYQLLDWPPINGVRLGFILWTNDMIIWIPDPEFSMTMERASWEPPPPSEVYATNFNGDIPFVETNDLSGRLRITREIISGNRSLLTGYYYDDSNNSWIEVASRIYDTTDNFNLLVQAWTHGDVFSKDRVKIAFDNFFVDNQP